MSHDVSALELQRLRYQPQLPEILRGGIRRIVAEEGRPSGALRDGDQIRQQLPKSYGQPLIRFVPGEGLQDLRAQRVGVVLSGGQAPGGHNVITGILDGIRSIHPDSCLFGFLGGPKGIFTERYVELAPEKVEPYRNTGGFDMIGSGRDKIETAEQMAACRQICEKLQLNGLVVIGGDDSNTNAAVLAEYFLEQGLEISVVGAPKTIDGDLRSEHVELSFGFDTAVKVYSELIGNICRDAKSAGKYWHFVKLMGRSASHVTLECALQTHANLALIGEEVLQRETTLKEIIGQMADLIRRRSEAGKHYGVCLIPEGLIEFIPEIRTLIGELNQMLAAHQQDLEGLEAPPAQREFLPGKLSPGSREVFDSLPEKIQHQLLMDRDSHGNVQVALIETESLLIEQVGQLLAEWKAAGRLDGKLQAQNHYLGYEGRCAAPTNFDANYTYCLGHVATLLIAFGKTGYMCSVRELVRPASEWKPGGVPLTSMMNMEKRKGALKPVIRKALVQIDGRPFKAFAQQREAWAMNDEYIYPGAIQYYGPPEVSDAPTTSLLLERADE